MGSLGVRLERKGTNQVLVKLRISRRRRFQLLDFSFEGLDDSVRSLASFKSAFEPKDNTHKKKVLLRVFAVS